MKKVILAFSGGLDTSFCVPFLRKKGYQISFLEVDSSTPLGASWTPWMVGRQEQRQ